MPINTEANIEETFGIFLGEIFTKKTGKKLWSEFCTRFRTRVSFETQ